MTKYNKLIKDFEVMSKDRDHHQHRQLNLEHQLKEESGKSKALSHQVIELETEVEVQRTRADKYYALVRTLHEEDLHKISGQPLRESKSQS